MSSRNGCCRCNNNSSSSTSLDFSPTPWYCRLLKPLTFFIVTTMLALSAFHLWGEFSASDSFWIIKSDLGKLRSQMSTLSLEVKNIIETRDELRSKLREVSYVVPRMSEAIGKLREEVSEEIAARTKVVLGAMSPDSVRDLVKSELQTYDADKTGRTDYALETLGSLPGECWAFKGSTGSVVIRLMGFVQVTGFSLEHISSSISPDGDTSAAPRDFTIWGLDHVDDEDGFLFGEFTYDNRASSSPLQYFPVQFQAQVPYEVVELRIHSNCGNPDYTCVYRIRVHGSLDTGCDSKHHHSSKAHPLMNYSFSIYFSRHVSSYVLLLLYIYIVHFFPLVAITLPRD